MLGEIRQTEKNKYRVVSLGGEIYIFKKPSPQKETRKADAAGRGKRGEAGQKVKLSVTNE